MYEFIKVSDKAYYIDCPSKIGVVRTRADEAVLIDTGNNKDTGKRVLKILDSERITPAAVYITHAHADHIGGNSLIRQRTGCPIYAKGIECAFTRYPMLEPALLYGADPLPDLCHRFLLAAESPAEELTEDKLPDGIRLLDLCGHTPDMVGFVTDEGIAYIADALSSAETLKKYGIGYIFDVEKYLLTLDRLKDTDAAIFIPSHAAPTENIAPLADHNISKVYEIAERILSLTDGGISFETLLSRLFSDYDISVDITQHALVGSTVRSYLTYLKKQGRITVDFKDKTLFFVKN